MTPNPGFVPLERLGLIAARGPDARKFLQGQLSQDVAALGMARVALAGLHNPQGRTVAILRLVPLAEDALLLALPGEIVDAVMQRLRRVVLRAKLGLADESAAWIRAGLSGPGARPALAAAGLDPPAGIGALARHADRIAWRHATDPERFIVLAPASSGLPDGWTPVADPHAAWHAWRAADVAAGLPQVYAATAESFVAQMLNLDALDGISFTKGCYTGQEVIARAHYRGRVKRRLQRFRTLAPLPAVPAPGATVSLADGRAARIVDAAELADGRVEFLAVTALDAGAGGDDDAAAAADAAAATTGTADAGAGAAPLAVEPLPLPYALPS